MADQILTFAALLAKIPHADIRAAVPVAAYANTSGVYVQEERDLLQLAHSETRGKLGTKVLVPGAGGLKSANGTSGSTIALYRINLAAGECMCASVYKRYAAQADIVLIGAGEWGKSYKLDGTAAVVLTADGQTYFAVVVQVLVSGAVELHAVFGAEAADAAEVEPDTAAIKAALVAAGIANHDASVGGVVARLKIQRVTVDTITMTHTDPASDDALAGERAVGTLFAVVTE